MHRYGILYQGKLLEYNLNFTSGGEYDSGQRCSLTPSGDGVWLTDLDTANKARLNGNDTPWYNEYYENPSHKLDPEDLEVVKVNLKVEHI